ncbi:MAG TPA: hypothetical protein VNO55_00530 [Polyangia bacterium]|nr:hypothetical protein [Polyangia bacterium]
MSHNRRRQALLVLIYATLGCGGGKGSSGTSPGSGGAGGTGGVGTDSAGSGGTDDVGRGGAPAAGGGGSDNGGSGGSGDAGPETEAGGVAKDGGAEGGDSEGCVGLFCEDFESGQVDPTKWTMPSIGTATMKVQQAIVAHGKHAMQFHGNANPPAADYAYIIVKNAPAALQKHNFGRAYVYAAPKPRDQNMGLVWGGTSGFPRPTYMSIANHGSGWQLGFIKLSGSPGGERQAYPTGDIPVATWFCLEWEFNDDPDEINVWGDGKMIGSLNNRDVGYPSGQAPGTPLFNNMNSNLIGAFTDFGFGFYDWHPQGRPAFDVYYDDIVLDAKRIGCL